MKPTPIELRERIVAARTIDGQSRGQIARRFRVPKGAVQNILERYGDEGTVEPRPQNAGRKSVFSAQALSALERDVRRRPDATLEELRERSGVQASLVSFHNALKRLGLTRKKHNLRRRAAPGGRGAAARRGAPRGRHAAATRH